MAPNKMIFLGNLCFPEPTIEHYNFTIACFLLCLIPTVFQWHSQFTSSIVGHISFQTLSELVPPMAIKKIGCLHQHKVRLLKIVTSIIKLPSIFKLIFI